MSSLKLKSFEIFVPILEAFLILLFVLFIFRCGGDGGTDNDDPIYNDDGICVANCLPDNNGTDNGQDGFIVDDNNGQDNPPVDGGGEGVDGKTDENEVEVYECLPMTPEQKEVCKPKEAKEAYCFNSTKTCGGGWIYEGQPCTTDAECQEVKPDQYPPCVCWGFCGYAGEWECGDQQTITFQNYTDDGVCHMMMTPAMELFGIPGNPKPRFPLNGEPEYWIELSEDGQTLYFDNGASCLKK